MSTDMAPPEASPESRVATSMRWLAARPTLVLIGVLIALILITTAIEPNYLSVTGLRNTAVFAVPIGILAASQTILMLTAGIDLSVAMIATGAAYVAANRSPSGAVGAILLGLLVGVVAGSANGIGVGVFRVNPLIMTLAMAGILLGLFTSWAQTIFSGATQAVGFIRTLGGGSTLDGRLPWAVLVWVAVAVAVIYMLRGTGFGRMLYALGDNPVATRLSGVRSWQVLLVAYMLSGLFAAIAGILLAGRVGNVDLSLAGFLLLPSVAATVIGGTSIFGGSGTYTGTILGALILGVLQSMLTFLNAGVAVQQIIYGLIVVILAWLYAVIARAA
jgi:ribose transport system permease protein